MDAQDDLLKFEQFLQRRSPDRRTPKDYLSDLRQFMGFCSKAWREVTMHDIDAFVDHERQRGLKPASIKRRAAALKTFFDFLAEETGELSWPKPVRMKRHAGKQPKPLPRDLHDDQVEALWQVITSPRDRAWFVLLLRAGLRAGEVVGLKLGDLLAPAQGQQPARLRVCGKGRKERVVLLSAEAYAILQAWLAVRPPCRHDYLFPNQRDGGPLTVSGLEYCLKQYPQQALPSLSKLLGHAQISTTQVYTAGADPQLSQAYQQAMARLENACFFVLAHTGLRASELIDLCHQDVDLPGGRLWVRAGKGAQDRLVYLSETARLALQRYLQGGKPPPTAPLFTHPDGRSLSYSWLYAHLLHLGQAALVIHVTAHRLRHTFATRLLNVGMQITRIQKLLGHKHLDTTMIYARVYEATVEADYRKAMRIIEQQQMPLSDRPLLAQDWPSSRKVIINVPDNLDNSV